MVVVSVSCMEMDLGLGSSGLDLVLDVDFRDFRLDRLDRLDVDLDF